MKAFLLAASAAIMLATAASAATTSLTETAADPFGHHTTWTVNCSAIRSYAQVGSTTNYYVAIDGMAVNSYEYDGTSIPSKVASCWSSSPKHYVGVQH